jgi:hypothetical protein
MIYPEVIGEFATLAALLTGKSIARYGDGELKLMDGKAYLREPPSEALAGELGRIIQEPHPACLVGIPTMDPGGPKYRNWLRHEKRFLKWLSPEVVYHSAFITRPDSAPWIRTVEFAEKIERLWKGKRATVLCEPGNSILRTVGLSAKKISHIECPHREAYAHIDRLERQIVGKRNEVALLSCGPTATCLAHRLAAAGVQAVDIGSAGGYLLKLLTGNRSSPLCVSPAARGRKEEGESGGTA